MTDSSVRIALIYPDILGTYGDVGNALILAQRLRWRGVSADVVTIDIDDELPESCDVYVFGGGEDAAQVLAATRLHASGALHRAVDRGAVVLGVCAGFQLLGTSFEADGRVNRGLELLDADTRRGTPRAVGHCLVEPTAFALPSLVGFENHGGRTVLGAGSQPLGHVLVGVGNGDAVDGACTGRVCATYLHGPVLAANPALADLLLSWATGQELAPLAIEEVDELRAARLTAVGGSHPRRGALARSRRRHHHPR